MATTSVTLASSAAMEEAIKIPPNLLGIKKSRSTIKNRRKVTAVRWVIGSVNTKRVKLLRQWEGEGEGVYRSSSSAHHRRAPLRYMKHIIVLSIASVTLLYTDIAHFTLTFSLVQCYT
jgi:hypothetical protein